MSRDRTPLLERPAFLVRLAQLSAASDRAWLAALLVGLIFTAIAAYAFPYPQSPSGKFWAYFGLLIRAAIFMRAGIRLQGRGGETLARLFALGLVAGAFELPIDWALIHWVKSGQLVYLSGNDVVLLGSPIWMPLAWACVIVELGYPALRLYGLWRARMSARTAAIVTTLLIAVAAGNTVGFYEYFAYRAGWWKYLPAHAMLGGFCALYIPFGEFLMFLAILPIAARGVGDDLHPRAAAIEAGARFAIAIAVGYGIAYALLEGVG
jgi:hypothetical protein